MNTMNVNINNIFFKLQSFIISFISFLIFLKEYNIKFIVDIYVNEKQYVDVRSLRKFTYCKNY